MPIVKIQRPANTSHPDAPWLIYAEGRRNIRLVPDWDIPPPIKKKMGADLKGYFKGALSPGGWKIGDRVPDQGW